MLRRALALARRADLGATTRGFAATVGDAGKCSGVPEDALARKARARTREAAAASERAQQRPATPPLCFVQVLIYSPARSASQHGKGGLGRWRIQVAEAQRYVPLAVGMEGAGQPPCRAAPAPAGGGLAAARASVTRCASAGGRTR